MKLSVSTVIWTIVLLAVVIIGALALRTEPIEVESAKVIVGDLEVTVREDGKTRIREKYVVSTPVAGRLARIELKEGDPITSERIAVILPANPSMLDARAKAQALARVEQAEAAVKRAESAAEQVKVNYDLAQTKLNRLLKLSESNSVSADELETAQSTALGLKQSLRTVEFDNDIAKYELKMAKAAVLQFSDDESESSRPFEVFAPARGKVLQVFQKSATVVNVGTPLIELGDPNNLEMVIDVLSTDAVGIKPGAKLIVDHWGGSEPLVGTVRVVEPAAFTKVSSLGVEEQRVNIVADFDEPEKHRFSLGDGYRIEARIVVQKLENTLMIPNSSLFRFQRKWHVFAIQNGMATMKPVTIGVQNETHTEVKEGLEEGGEIILYPNDKISEGSPIVRAGE